MQMAWKGGCAGAVLVICFGDAFLGVAPLGVPVGIPWCAPPVLGSLLSIATLMIALLSMKRPPVTPGNAGPPAPVKDLGLQSVCKVWHVSHPFPLIGWLYCYTPWFVVVPLVGYDHPTKREHE